MDHQQEDEVFYGEDINISDIVKKAESRSLSKMRSYLLRGYKKDRVSWIRAGVNDQRCQTAYLHHILTEKKL